MGIGVQFQQLYAKMGSSREDHATKTRNFCFGFNSNERWFFENWKISKIWTHTTVVPKVTNLDYNNSQCTECNTKIQVQLGIWKYAKSALSPKHWIYVNMVSRIKQMRQQRSVSLSIRPAIWNPLWYIIKENVKNKLIHSVDNSLNSKY